MKKRGLLNEEKDIDKNFLTFLEDIEKSVEKSTEPLSGSDLLKKSEEIANALQGVDPKSLPFILGRGLEGAGFLEQGKRVSQMEKPTSFVEKFLSLFSKQESTKNEAAAQTGDVSEEYPRDGKLQKAMSSYQNHKDKGFLSYDLLEVLLAYDTDIDEFEKALPVYLKEILGVEVSGQGEFQMNKQLPEIQERIQGIWQGRGSEGERILDIKEYLEKLSKSLSRLSEEYPRDGSAEEGRYNEAQDQFGVFDDSARELGTYQTQDDAEIKAKKLSQTSENEPIYVVDLSAIKNNEDPIGNDSTAVAVIYVNGEVEERSEVREEAPVSGAHGEVYEATGGLKLFVWEEVFTDYTDGIAFALANNENEARQLILKEHDEDKYNYSSEKDSYAAQELKGKPAEYTKPIGFYLYGGS